MLRCAVATIWNTWSVYLFPLLQFFDQAFLFAVQADHQLPARLFGHVLLQVLFGSLERDSLEDAWWILLAILPKE